MEMLQEVILILGWIISIGGGGLALIILVQERELINFKGISIIIFITFVLIMSALIQMERIIKIDY